MSRPRHDQHLKDSLDKIGHIDVHVNFIVFLKFKTEQKMFDFVASAEIITKQEVSGSQVHDSKAFFHS